MKGVLFVLCFSLMNFNRGDGHLTCHGSFNSYLCELDDWTRSMKEWKESIEKYCSGQDLGTEWQELFSCPDQITVTCCNETMYHCYTNALNCTICYCTDGTYAVRPQYRELWSPRQTLFRTALRLYNDKLSYCGGSFSSTECDETAASTVQPVPGNATAISPMETTMLVVETTTESMMTQEKHYTDVTAIVCPAGTELRYDRGSCCNITGQPRLGQPRIVGGVPSEAGQWPWMVFILISDGSDTFGCGGFLVDNLHVISAAHCYLDNPTVQLRFGNVDINEATTIINLDGSDVVVHPDYDNVTFDNDIMIINLRSPITFDSNIASVSLPNGETSPNGTTCFVAGWGATSSGGVGSDILLETSINIQPISDCDPIFSNPLNDTIQICAGFAPGGQDSCQGDSGGPLMCQRCRNCDWFAAGIVSFGFECALPETPAVYARVSAYEEWLYENGVTDEGVEFDCN